MRHDPRLFEAKNRNSNLVKTMRYERFWKKSIIDSGNSITDSGECGKVIDFIQNQ
jgi:16S rRNA G527 N7-methylase RsmG